MSDIFISYASQDRAIAQELATLLADEGWTVWWDRTIPPGKTFPQMIEEALSDTRCVVVLWSQTSKGSDWVQKEARFGAKRRILIPAMIEEVEPPFEFDHIQGAALMDWDGDTSHLGYRQLIAAIFNLVGAPQEREEPTGEAPEEEHSERELAKEKARNRSAVEAIRQRQAELLGDRQGLQPAPADEESAEAKPIAKVEDGRLVAEVKRQRKGSGSAKTPKPENLPHLSVFRDIDEPWCPEMVVLPAGTFMMGSPDTDEQAFDDEKPHHEVTIGYRLAVGRHPVTVEEYARFVYATGRKHDGGIWCREKKKRWWGLGNEYAQFGVHPAKSWQDPGFAQSDRHPVVGVNWDDAKAFVVWLGKQTGKSYRLLSEAEWEYVCRAGTETRYSFGDTISHKDANFERKVDKTTAVGAYPANPWGLYDMHGNVHEWVEDVWHFNYTGAPDDGGPWTTYGDRGLRVLRGGSWSDDPVVLGSANRSKINWGFRNLYVGFRVARTL